MSYYFSKSIHKPLEEVEAHVRQVLQSEGFGVLTEIDVQKTLKKKLDVEMHPYRILGACNPPLAYQALQAEDKIGTMLPCNVILQERDGVTEVAAVDPVASMQAVENSGLTEVAGQVRTKLKKVIEQL